MIRLDHFTELVDLATRLPGRITYDLEVDHDELQRVGSIRTQVFTDGARDYAEKEIGRLTIRAWAPARDVTPEERRRLTMKLVDASVDAGGEPI